MPRLSPSRRNSARACSKSTCAPALAAVEDVQYAEADLRVAKLVRRQLLAAGDDHLPVPGTFLCMAAEPPVLPGHRAQLERRPGLVLVQEPGDRGGEVIVLGFQPVQPGHLAGSFQARPGGLGELQEMGSVPVVRLLPLAALAQPFASVVAD